MEDKLGQEPAFSMPCGEGRDKQNIPVYNVSNNGMSKRCYAAIELRVPDSGEEWLDEMIKKANKRDAARAAMQGLLSSVNPRMFLDDNMVRTIISNAYQYADETLKQENL